MRPGTGHRSRPVKLARAAAAMTALVLALVTVVIGAGVVGGRLTLADVRDVLTGNRRSSVGAAALPGLPQPSPDDATASLPPLPTPPASPTPVTTTAGSGTATSASTGLPTASSPSASSATARTSSPTRRPSTSSNTAAPSNDALSQPILNQINSARAAAGLPALTKSPGLVRSATRHTQLMASGCGLSHQCSGEATLANRISAQGVAWGAVGENVGMGGPVTASNTAIVGMAAGITSSMLAEKPPNDGHRRNILSSTFRHIGICVYRDANGTVWMTQDFSD